MILETLPRVLALTTGDKELLCEELLQQIALERHDSPTLRQLVQSRRAEHLANPSAGVTWHELYRRLLPDDQR